MATDERPPDDGLSSDALANLSRKLDTVAGALAAVASSHTDLLAHVAEAEARRSHDAREVAQRLSAMERQMLDLPSQAPPPPSDPLDPFPIPSVTADLEQLRSDVTLALEVLAQVAAGVERLGSHDDRSRAGDGSAAPVLDLDTQLATFGEDLGSRLTHHTDVALAAALRVIDDRLVALRQALLDGGARS